VLGGVLANDVDHWRSRLPGVVKIGECIAQAGAKVQQCRCRPPTHSSISIRRTRTYAFEQAEDAAHSVHAIESGYKLHLGRAGIHEARVHCGEEQGS
jgi:hypothetical protein